ncbi:MAG: hypothetical protein SVM86_06350 [Candidatus Cloacimonadota bacterium]|nr:hypothetical protein [Candidatus Cloacimonadota bacterium]
MNTMKVFLIVVIVLIGVNMANALGKRIPQVEIFLNNNPRCSAELENVAKGEKWELVNIPSITVKGSNFDNGNMTMTVIFKDEIIANVEINVVDHDFVETIELSSPLENPKWIEVKVGTSFHEKIPVELKRLYGAVTYFDGAPVSYPIISTGEGMVTVGDEKGNFEMFLCGKEKSIGIFEKNYSKTTLECWLYGVDLKEDTKLNVRIDKLEVYELGAWQAATGIYIHFIPMSLTRISELTMKETSEINIAIHKKAWPHLRKNDIKVFIDEKEIPISTFNEYEDFIGEYKGKKVTRPGYILGIARENWEKGIVKVEIKHRVKSGAKEILEKGEGYFFGFISDE